MVSRVTSSTSPGISVGLDVKIEDILEIVYYFFFYGNHSYLNKKCYFLCDFEPSTVGQNLGNLKLVYCLSFGN